jgi:hypothetical protein
MNLTDFLQAFFPEPDEPLYLFGYSPKEMPEAVKAHPVKIMTCRAELQTDKALQSRLRQINQTQGVYFTVNSGGTLKSEIDRINAVFCEIDDLPLIEQHDLYDHCEYPPSIRVETRKSVHAYWLLEEEITVDDFIFIQNGLIEKFRSDKALKNQNRVMRLPFFKHLTHTPEGFQYKSVSIHTFNDHRFTLSELKEYYSPTPKKLLPVFEQKSESDYQDLFEELRRRVRALPTYHVEHGGKLASAQGICHNGETNRTLVENLSTGIIFCRNECTFDEIIAAFGLERPKKKERIVNIPRVPAPKQNSTLYQWVDKYEKMKETV